MADVTGVLHVERNGKSYDLHLTMRGIAALQARHGRDLGGLLSGDDQQFPDFGILLNVVEVALQKGSGLTEDAAREAADVLLTADPELVARLLQAAFPTIEGLVGNAPDRKAPAG